MLATEGLLARTLWFMATDPVLEQLDADIATAQAELTRLLDIRSWWKTRQAESRAVAADRDRKAEKGPTTKEWIRRVLADGAHLGGAEIAKAAVNLGWKTKAKKPDIVIRNVCRDLEERGQIARDGHGKYFLPAGQAARGLFAVEN